MSSVQSVVFLHGLGEGPGVWDAQRAAVPSGFEGVAVDVFNGADSGTASAFSLERAATLVVSELDRLGIEQAHLCGLSLGAMIALQVTLDHPTRVRSLALAAGQVKPPRVLMAAQFGEVERHFGAGDLVAREHFEGVGVYVDDTGVVGLRRLDGRPVLGAHRPADADPAGPSQRGLPPRAAGVS